jgi:hypothetical protein
MRYITTITVLIFCFVNTIMAQKHKLQKLFVTDTVLPIPESVLFNKAGKFLFVSLMDGSPSGRDGKGSIGKLNTNGEIINLNWISGLNAPKGMARFKNILYVADLTEIVIIDIPNQKIIKKITVEAAKVLNDVTVDEKGVVYLSDPKSAKIFKLENDVVSVYLENLIKPNGLKFIQKHLYFLDNGALFKLDRQKNKTTIVEGLDENTDGIEQVKTGEYIVSCWNGIIYYVKENGTKEILSDTRKEEYYTADIGYDAKKKIVYIPSLFKKTVSAYLLK